MEDDVNLYPKHKNVTYLNLFFEQPLLKICRAK